MPDYTPRLNLPLPLGTENVTRQAHIDLVNAIDANAQPLIPAQATAPENPKDGMLWVDTSGTPYQLKQYEAASWNLVGTDTTELQQTVTAHLADYAQDTGVANAYAITLTPAPAAYELGKIYKFKAANTNTGASTFAIGALVATAIKKDVSAALTAGDIPAGAIVAVVYDGTNFQLLSRTPLSTEIAKFKKGNGTFTDNDTSQTFTDAFCTANSLVVISITSVTPPQGTWSVESADGSFTITSTATESADITFDYFITKVVG